MIDRPIIICGLPRTGTTHLHNLIAADPAIRYLPYWESLEPFPAPGEDDRSAAPGPVRGRPGHHRHLDARVQADARDDGRPRARRDPAAGQRHLRNALRNPVSAAGLRARTTSPTTRRRRTPISNAPCRRMQWLRGGTRWVLKSPQHLEQFPALYETFPDATFVVTHRDPVEVTQSMATMISYASRMTMRPTRSREDQPRTGSTAPTTCSTDAYATATCCPPASPSTCGSTTSWPTKPAPSQRSTHWPTNRTTSGRSAAMAQFCAEHPRGRHGGVSYAPEDLGLDTDEVASEVPRLSRPLRQLTLSRT